MASIQTHTANGFGNPGRVSREQLIIGRCAQKTHHTQLHDKMVDKLLNLAFGINAVFQIALRVDIQECGDTSQRHGGAVLFLDSSKIRKIQPLDCLFGVLSRAGNIITIACRHFFEFPESTDLLGSFFSLADKRAVKIICNHALKRFFLLFNQKIDAIQRHSAIIPNDSAAAIGVWQTGDNPVVACLFHLIRIDVEHAVVVGFPVLEYLFHLRIHLFAISFQRSTNHTNTAKRHNGTLQRGVRLKANDCFLLFVNISRFMGSNGRNCMVVNIEYTAFCVFLVHQCTDFLPQFPCAVGRSLQKGVIPIIGGIVVDNEVSDIDFVVILTVFEIHFFSSLK